MPFQFKLEFACKVANPDEVEAALHEAFAPQRVNPRREFFQIEPAQVIAILKLLHTEDATREVEPPAADPQEERAAEQYEQSRAPRRPNFNFIEMGIPIGSVLVADAHPEKTVEVIGPKKVRAGDEDLSLTAATRIILELAYDAPPLPYWTYNGKPLSEIYEDTYNAEA